MWPLDYIYFIDYSIYSWFITLIVLISCTFSLHWNLLLPVNKTQVYVPSLYFYGHFRFLTKIGMHTNTYTASLAVDYRGIMDWPSIFYKSITFSSTCVTFPRHLFDMVRKYNWRAGENVHIKLTHLFIFSWKICTQSSQHFFLQIHNFAFRNKLG